jgi:membrane associated rhomboid family serine protease
VWHDAWIPYATMLVLPVALERNEVRRTPWVTFALIGSCVLAFMALSMFAGDADREASRKIEETLRFLGQHPYLSPSPGLLELLGKEGREALDRIASEWEAAGGLVGPTAAEAEQQQLNALTEEALLALRRLPSSRLGFVPARPNPIALVTYTFVHAGWLHLLGNMLFLFLTGPFVEDLYGRPLFTLLYLVSGISAAGAFAAGAPSTHAALVGASGAIAGVMAAFLVRLAARRIEFLVLPFVLIPAFRFKLRLPAFVVIPLWAAEQAYYTFSVAGAGSPVAFSAHVGGFVAGLAFAGGMVLLHVEQRFVNPAIEREIGLEQNPGVTRAAEARFAGDLASARRLIDVALRNEPGNVDAWTESFEIALAGGDAARAGQAGLKLIDIYGRSDPDMVWDVVGDSRWRELRMPPRFLSAVADLLARAGDAREAIEIYRRLGAEAAPGDVASLRALVSEGELLLRAGDERGARQAFDRARGHPACSEPWLERIELSLVSRPNRGARP